MSDIQYLLDENVNPRLRKVLRRLDRAMSVRAIGEAGAPPLRTPDPIILNWCEEHDFILVTNNRKSCRFISRSILRPIITCRAF